MSMFRSYCHEIDISSPKRWILPIVSLVLGFGLPFSTTSSPLSILLGVFATITSFIMAIPSREESPSLDYSRDTDSGVVASSSQEEPTISAMPFDDDHLQTSTLRDSESSYPTLSESYPRQSFSSEFSESYPLESSRSSQKPLLFPPARPLSMLDRGTHSAIRGGIFNASNAYYAQLEEGSVDITDRIMDR